MSIWEKFARALISVGEMPKAYSLFHIVALILIVGVTVVICIFNKKINKKTYKIIILTTWIVLVILEAFKQLTNSMHIRDDKLVYYYHWLVFPFQFCSSPLYLLPFIVFLKEGVVKKRIELFSSIFMLVGGLAGCLIPSFGEIIWINYHTLIFHGTMIFIPILIALKNKEEFQLRNLLECSIVFFVLVAIALFLNWVVPKCTSEAVIHGFNMFFISWHLPPTVPILKDIYQAVPYAVYLLIYIVGFLLIIFIFYIIYSIILNHKICLSFKVSEPGSKTKKSTKKSSK